MNETNVGQVLVDCMEVSFPHHYQMKAFIADASRLRDLAILRTRQALTEEEIAEVRALRTRLRRTDGDSVLLSVIKTRHSGGLVFF